jgi:uncharacterized protein YydD (DUF2326 family)
MEIETGLSQMFPRNLDIEQPTAITTAAAQQQSENELNQYAFQLQNALEQMGKTMKIIADQKEEIAELRKHVADIEKKQQEQQEYIDNKLEERDQKLMVAIRENQEVKKQVAVSQEKKKSWISRLFQK